jgi:hypothetical protein
MSTTTPLKRSPAQADQSRINGSKSHGPITPQGKCKVSKNRMAHGFRAKSIALCNEDKEVYDKHLDAYLARYTPADKVEEDLVGLLASSMWQLMRNNSIEVALFDLEMTGVNDDIEAKFVTMDQYGRLALAFKKSAGDNALELLRRYKSTAERAYHRALQALEEIHKSRKPQQPETFSAVQTPDSAPEPISQPPNPEPIATAAATEIPPEPEKPRPILLSSRPDHPNPEPADS